MRDFKDFEEVKHYLLNEDGWNGVFVGGLYFSVTSMACGEGCCDEVFRDVDETLGQITRSAGGNIDRVQKA